MVSASKAWERLCHTAMDFAFLVVSIVPSAESSNYSLIGTRVHGAFYKGTMFLTQSFHIHFGLASFFLADNDVRSVSFTEPIRTNDVLTF